MGDDLGGAASLQAGLPATQSPDQPGIHRDSKDEKAAPKPDLKT